MKWEVHEAGYRWDDSVLIPIDDNEKRKYGVRDTLFREFVETPPTEEGVLGFANKYGRLYLRYRLEHDIDADFGVEVRNAETLDSWRYHILHMRAALLVWDDIQKNRKRNLRNCIDWGTDPQSGKKWIKYQWHKDCPHPYIYLLTDEPFKQGEIEKPARMWVIEVINRMLAPIPGLGDQRTRVHQTIKWDHDIRHQPIIEPISQSLIGELWLQFALLVTTGYQLRACKECGNWFTSKPKRGPEQVFCSGACRTRAYRRKSK